MTPQPSSSTGYGPLAAVPGNTDPGPDAFLPTQRYRYDPLKLIRDNPPSECGRVVLWVILAMIAVLIVWAAFGKLDIITSAQGRLVPQTLVKIVQPAESGVVRELLVEEGDSVRAGQVLARLNATLATADRTGVSSELATLTMQVRRMEAELGDRLMQARAGDDAERYAQVQNQYIARRKAFIDAHELEKTILSKLEHERRSALAISRKLEQALPTYTKSAEAYARLEKEGFYSGLAAAEKQRDALEKTRDLDAQSAMVASVEAGIAAQHKKISQLKSAYQSELQKELADTRARIAQLQPSLDKTVYREGLMALRAPQDGVIQDLATTTVGAVVQPGAVVMTLVPRDEQLFADVNIRNEDVGFTQVGQAVQIKLAAYPFQKYGMLTGKVIRISPDAREGSNAGSTDAGLDDRRGYSAGVVEAVYKARIKLDGQTLNGPHGRALTITPGMQVVAEINQGKRTVLEYLLSPVQKTVAEAGRER